jgi:N-sulfoglucosamine sulfohydrolase
LIQKIFCLLTLLFFVQVSAEKKRPNILFCIADDWGYHASSLGDPVIKTPVFDELVKTGVLFENAYCSSPSCAPSRAAIVTGQWHWRLDKAANLYGTIPEQHKFYTFMLEDAGYHVGFTRKGWGPGKPAGGKNPAGKRYKNFSDFLKARPKNKPFCFWFGSQDPHRGYKKDSGAKSGMDITKIKIPACFPDSPEVRGDVADYFFEVQRFDREVGEHIKQVEDLGEIDNTIIVVSSDHGMPFPRCKSNVYDDGARVPLVIKIPGGAAGRVVSDFVSLTDLAPTFLNAAGLEPDKAMTGMNLMPVLQKEIGTEWKPRSYVLTGKERHVPGQEEDLSGYPMRALRNKKFLLIKNYEPERWPAGTPNYMKAFIKKAWLADCDNGPTKSYIVDNKDKDSAHKNFYELSFGKRPALELYDLSKDPDQLKNVASNPEYASVIAELKAQMEKDLKETLDPREIGNGEKFDKFKYSGGAPKKQ